MVMFYSYSEHGHHQMFFSLVFKLLSSSKQNEVHDIKSKSIVSSSNANFDVQYIDGHT
jgi:hypothetical protein